MTANLPVRSLALASLLLACSSDHDTVRCGEGTVEVSGACVAEDLDPSTSAEPGARADAGTRADAGSRTPDAGVDGSVTLSCGAGTYERDGECVVASGARYELRVGSPTIEADGRSKIPLLATGTTADGEPSTEQVVFNTSRPGAGSFLPPTAKLGGLGAAGYFVPCNATTPGCTGPVKLTLALASDPNLVVASADVELADVTGVGSAAPCLGGGNVMFFDGNDYIYNGQLTVDQGSFSASGSAQSVDVRVSPGSQSQGLWWTLNFHGGGMDLVPGVYRNAERAPFASSGRPGIDVGGDGRGCNTISGEFQVHEYTFSQGAPQAVTISFIQHCEQGAAELRGCVHYEAP